MSVLKCPGIEYCKKIKGQKKSFSSIALFEAMYNFLQIHSRKLGYSLLKTSGDYLFLS